MSRSSGRSPFGLRHHLAFTLGAAALFILMLSLLRVALFLHNRDQLGDTPLSVLLEGFANGLRFDLRLTVYACIPLLLALLWPPSFALRRTLRAWLVLCAAIAALLGILELDFYREFHQRLNALVFQYLQEDSDTVASMIWNGFPVARYLLAWGLTVLLFGGLLARWDRRTRPAPGATSRRPPLLASLAVFALCLLVSVIAARGNLRQGPPLRWGDAYTTDSMFVNHLGLNATLSLVDAARHTFSAHRDNQWKGSLAPEKALQQVRQMLVGPRDQLVDVDQAAIRRDSTPPQDKTLGVRNVVVILMESFSGHYTGALGSDAGITPNFDRLSRDGLLFTRFFSNGTHTHQGMFATMACFPNLPGFEYLMRTPEGSHQFSGLPQQLSARGYDDVYVYNGNFQWDNQSGFFSNQGMRHFVGREDFVNPVFMDPTWGVSDQDMFDRGVTELNHLQAQGKPFYALLQTLSNHTPYALPSPLPVQPVTGHGSLDEHLTAMRYADWALGRFFDEARKQPWYRDTLFVVLGDHGFGAERQLTEMDLFRFNVPLLLIAPGIQQRFGERDETVGSQVDVVPTIMARLGGQTRQQCWGRDLLDLPAGDPGRAIIKPSGGGQSVAIVEGGRILVKSPELAPMLYDYHLGGQADARKVEDPLALHGMGERLDAFLQTATRSLLENTTGVRVATP